MMANLATYFQMTLPIPPSVNAMYVNRAVAGKRGRMISPAYRAWLKAAEGRLWQHGPRGTFAKPVSVLIEIEQAKRHSDIDGRIKATLDFLVKHNILLGDDWRYVTEVTARWSAQVSECLITVVEA